MSPELKVEVSYTMQFDVLIVDDNDLVRKTLEQVLAIHSLSYISVTNGSEALSLLTNNEVKFIISDIDMPVMNGLELAKRVRETYPDVTIVAFTGSSGNYLLGDAEKYFHTIYSKSESAMIMAGQIRNILQEQLAMA